MKMKLHGIVTKFGVYISDAQNQKYHSSKIDICLFDGKKATPSHHQLWFHIDDIPQKVERELKPEKKLVGYKLKNESLTSDQIPIFVNPEFFDFGWVSDKDDNAPRNHLELWSMYAKVEENCNGEGVINYRIEQ